jgi:hypothetical protein
VICSGGVVEARALLHAEFQRIGVEPQYDGSGATAASRYEAWKRADCPVWESETVPYVPVVEKLLDARA